MSDEETVVDTSNAQMLTAEYKDGQLQIVEMTPFERDKNQSILPDDGEQKYMRIVDSDNGAVQLDLLNLTLVRCGNGEESYRLVTHADGTEIADDGTVTCVLQSGDEETDQDQYVMMDGDQQTLVIMQSPSPSSSNPTQEEIQPDPDEQQDKESLTPAQILEKAKALRKVKALLASQAVRRGRRGRRSKGELPPTHELLSSPHFKLYLYSCKLCEYKCNATKELQAHRAAEHSSGSNKSRTSGPGGRGSYISLQCAQCPFRAANQTQLLKHSQVKHSERQITNKVSLDSKEVEEADVLVCGACGFESGDRPTFRRHIEDEHGATTD